MGSSPYYPQLPTRQWIRTFIIVSTGSVLLFLYSQHAVNLTYGGGNPGYSGALYPFWEDDHEYLVKTGGCKLLHMDPFDPSVNKFFRNSRKPKCKEAPVILVSNQTLTVRKKLTGWKFKGVTECCYRGIRRLQQNTEKYDSEADYSIIIKKNCTKIPTSPNGIRVDEQYVKVECINKDKGVKVWQDFFPVVIPPDELTLETEEKVRFWKDFINERNKNETNNGSSTTSLTPPNILIIGIDSISRLQMYRSLPRTRELLQAKGFVEMKGYTKLGENTFPNIMAALGGMKDEKEHAKCWPSRWKKMDNCPFIWNNFRHKLNYITAHVEDSPGIAIFNYDKTGFVVPPADYYIRPLLVAEHKSRQRSRYGGSNDCLAGGLTPTDTLLRYMQTFVSSMASASSPFFLLSWMTSVGHDDFNGLQAYDKEYRQFLQDLIDKVGDNSYIFFISDHGYRFGKFRETFLGFYEESLPFHFVRVPPSLYKERPMWVKNLHVNGHKLTTPLDLYSTLMDIYGMAEERMNHTHNTTQFQYGKRSPSYFELGLDNRTCEDSFIPQKYCMCGVSPKLSPSSDLTKDFGALITTRINELVTQSNVTEDCMEFSFTKVLYAREVGEGEKWNQLGKIEPHKDYIVAIETDPWEARFEARVRQWTQRGSDGGGEDKEILGSIGRINTYKGSSECITDYRMKNYCVCKSLWAKEQDKRDKKKKKKKKKG